MKKIYYFCTVKSSGWHKAAVRVQRFFLPNFIGIKILSVSRCVVAVMPTGFNSDEPDSTLDALFINV